MMNEEVVQSRRLLTAEIAEEIRYKRRFISEGKVAYGGVVQEKRRDWESSFAFVSAENPFYREVKGEK